MKKLLFCVFNEKLNIQIPLLKILNLTVHLTFPKLKDYFSTIDISKFIQKMNERKANDNANNDGNNTNNNNNDTTKSLGSNNELASLTDSIENSTTTTPVITSPTSITINNKKNKKGEVLETAKNVYDDQVNEKMLGKYNF